MSGLASPISMDGFDVALGAVIEANRSALQVSQHALSAAVGVSGRQVQNWEKGVNRITVHRLCQVADALDIPVADLIGDAVGLAGAERRRRAISEAPVSERVSA